MRRLLFYICSQIVKLILYDIDQPYVTCVTAHGSRDVVKNERGQSYILYGSRLWYIIVYIVFDTQRFQYI